MGRVINESTTWRRFTMATQDNKTISRRFFEEVWNEGNLDAIDNLATQDSVLRDRDMGEHRGTGAAREFIGTYRKAFPDLRFTIEEQIAEGDTVVTRWRARGTHRGELMGIPPTEKSVTVSGVTIDRVTDGKIAESIGSWDALGLMQQLGVLSGQPGGQS
jgi:steroid delta-isomerase-like uncharacterized protein